MWFLVVTSAQVQYILCGCFTTLEVPNFDHCCENAHSLYCVAKILAGRLFGRLLKIIWKIAENMSFGGIYFDG